MGKLSCHVRRWRAGIVLALLAAMLAAPGAALADRDGRDDRGGGDGDGRDRGRNEERDEGRRNNLNCPGRETLARVDENICPPNGRRPLIVRKRACCQNPQGRIHCDHFEHCPNESPS